MGKITKHEKPPNFNMQRILVGYNAGYGYKRLYSNYIFVLEALLK